MLKKMLWAFLFPLVLGLVLGGCADQSVTFAEPPELDITCPDPEMRRMLVQGSTFRDLAESRIEALEGWRVCSDALKISTQE